MEMGIGRLVEWVKILKSYKMIGNAVPVNLAYYMAKRIKWTLESRGIRSKKT